MILCRRARRIRFASGWCRCPAPRSRRRIWRKPSQRSAKPRTKGRRSSACRSCSARSTSAAKRTRNCSTWPSRFPARPPRRSASSRGNCGVVVIASLFEKRAQGLYHNTAAIIDADGSYRGPVPQDAHPGRSAVLREVLLHAGRPGLPEFRHAVSAGSARSSAGTSGIRKARGWPACRARRCCSIRPPSAGIRRRRRSTARRSSTPGDHPARARHRQRSLRRRGQSRRLRRDAGTRASNSGARRSSPIRSAR